MHIKRIAGVVTAAAVVLTPLIVLGVADPSPTQHYAATVTDGVFAAVAASDGSFYVAGNYIAGTARSYGNAILASASTGLSESPFPDVDNDVNVVISDGAGGWYIAGDFNRVGPLERSNLAHINADGTADADFDADVNLNCGLCTAGDIKALALDEDDGILYVGGYFPSITFGATTVDGLVALDATDGSVLGSFGTPDISGADESVYTLALEEDDNYLYVGGSFTTIGVATTRNNIAGFDAITGATTSFDPNVNGDVLSFARNEITDGLYASGIFTMVNGGTTRNRVALFDTTMATGNVDATFNPNANNTVNTLALDINTGVLYLGGNFTLLAGGASPDNLAAVNMGDGASRSWNPDVDGPVLEIALTADGSQLYAVGFFSSVDGGTDRDSVAAFDTTMDTGNVLPFQQSIDQDAIAIALSDDETSALIGAEDGANSYADSSALVAVLPIYHILADGTFDPDFDAYVNDSVYTLALSPDEATLYAGGAFTLVGVGTTRNHLVAFDAGSGATTSFDPDLDGYVYALAISSDGDTLYAGGEFSNVNVNEDTEPRTGLAAFDTDIDPTDNALSFDADISGAGSDVYALELTADDSVLYIGGDFTAVDGPTMRNNIAAVTTADGIATAFDPGTNNDVGALALSSDETTVYAGGDFDEVNDPAMARFYAAAFDATTGVATDFDPDVDGSVETLAFGPDGVLYMGGNFNDTDHEYIVAVDPETGTPDAGFVTSLDDTVYALAHGGTGNGLLAGGRFKVSFEDELTELPYVRTNYLAHYADSSTPTPTPATPTPTPGSGGSSGGGGSFLPGATATPTPSSGPLPTVGDPLNLARYGLREGDTVSSRNSDDPDIYIVNEHGYKRLFLNPVIFNFYGHLGWSKVRSIVPTGRDVFPTSGLFRNCETGDPRVWAVEVMGEDTGVLHHVQISGAAAVSQDPEFFKKVFCINNNEFNWYPKSPVPYTSLSQVPVYSRR